MWFGTDHYWCKDNLNLLWAWPVHVVFIFFRNKKTGQLYFKLVFAAAVLFLLFQFFLPQHFPLAVLFFVVIIALRSWFPGSIKKA
jgi:hypothetical protein